MRCDGAAIKFFFFRSKNTMWCFFVGCRVSGRFSNVSFSFPPEMQLIRGGGGALPHPFCSPKPCQLKGSFSECARCQICLLFVDVQFRLTRFICPPRSGEISSPRGGGLSVPKHAFPRDLPETRPSPVTGPVQIHRSHHFFLFPPPWGWPWPKMPCHLGVSIFNGPGLGIFERQILVFEYPQAKLALNFFIAQTCCLGLCIYFIRGEGSTLCVIFTTYFFGHLIFFLQKVVYFRLFLLILALFFIFLFKYVRKFSGISPIIVFRNDPNWFIFFCKSFFIYCLFCLLILI